MRYHILINMIAIILGALAGPQVALAAGAGFCRDRCLSERQFILFAGAGVGYGTQDLYSRNLARFSGLGWNVEGGSDLPLGEHFGVRASALVGRMSLNNSANSDDAVETATNQFYGAKAGLIMNLFGIGGGLRHDSFDSTAVSRNNPTLKTSLTGFDYFGYAQINLLAGDHLAVTPELQYHKGTLSGTAYTELSFFVNLVLYFQVR